MIEKFIKVQNELKAPKSQFNAFGKYKYRNCEDILEAVKPLLFKYGLLLTITDKLTEINGDNFVEATATVTDGEKTFSVSAQAGLDLNKKGMDKAQATGTSSSYARKYCLNGLFLIDDTKDSDSMDNRASNASASKAEDSDKAWLNKGTPEFDKAATYLKGGGQFESLLTKYKISKAVREELNNLI